MIYFALKKHQERFWIENDTLRPKIKSDFPQTHKQREDIADKRDKRHQDRGCKTAQLIWGLVNS